MVGKTILSCLMAALLLSVYTPEPRFVEQTHPVDMVENDVLDDAAAFAAGRAPIRIGDSLDTVLAKFGDAEEVLASEYGFLWYIYPNDYKDYIQIGMLDGAVAAVYSNSPHMLYRGVGCGSSMDDVRITFGDGLDVLRKGHVNYHQNNIIDGKRERDLFLLNGVYITVFYDIHKNNTVTSLQLIREDVEQGLNGFYAAPSDELKYSYEQQNFYATNAVRVREGYPPFTWNSKIADVAVGHSRDMAEHDYFSHDTPDGKSVMDRAIEGGLKPSMVAENIAYGGQNGIVMLELLMNSAGHRKNILGDCERMGVGVWFNNENIPYLTQNFYTPPRVNVR